MTTYDAVIVGAGLAGLVAAGELVEAGRRVALVDQENASNLGGQAYWSFGGLFLVDSPEQRRLGVLDSFDLAWSDWRGSAGWDRLDGDLAQDVWAQRWGRAYVEFAAGEKRDWLRVLKTRLGQGASPEVEAFKAKGADFVVAGDLDALVDGMNAPTPTPLLDARQVRGVVEARDAQVANPFAKDLQIQGVHNARRYLGDRLARVAKPHRILDPKAGPLIAVKLHVLTRKSLGGIQTDLDSRVLKADGSVLEGLFAAGEAAGFGGGGAHGYNALEGSFLGGCRFTGRAAGRAMA